MFKVILKAIALAMAVAAIVLAVLGAADVSTLIAMLGIGLFTLALASF